MCSSSRSVIVEVKAVEKLAPDSPRPTPHLPQAALATRVGLLLNFNVEYSSSTACDAS